MKTLDVLKRFRNTWLLLAALALGSLAAFGTREYIEREIAVERDRLQPRVETVRVVVARNELARGDVASAQTMAVRDVPKEFVPGTAIRPEQFEGWSGARLTVAMRAGETLLQGSLEGADVATFSSKVRNGIRALTVAVDEINSISGMLQPGDRIDLMLSVRLAPPGGGPNVQETTRPLMQDLRVLATGRQVRPGGDERSGRTYTAITVEVTPEQAQRLVVAQRSGKLTAMLRNPGDHAPIAQQSLDVYGLLGIDAARAAEAPPASPDLIVGGRGPLKAVAGLANAVQSAAGALLAGIRIPGAPAAFAGAGGDPAGGAASPSWAHASGAPAESRAPADARASAESRAPLEFRSLTDARVPAEPALAPGAESITFR